MQQTASKRTWWLIFSMALGALVIALSSANPALARKRKGISSNSSTGRLFNLVNTSLGGKLDIYLLGGVTTEASGKQLQQVLHVTYDQSLYFGRFTVHVRNVTPLNPQQLIVYTPKQIFNFGNVDAEEFEKINPGPFGSTGDLYLASSGDAPPAVAPITDAIRQQYETLLSQYIIPAVQKQAGKS